MANREVVGRFAPSPTGRMHAGNIFAALMSWLIVKSQSGRMVLRIDDLDIGRSRQSYADEIMRDFESLGLTWDEGPYYQQGNDEAYLAAFKMISDEGLAYPCFCTRADLKAASAPHRGEKAVYPGTCAHLNGEEIAARMAIRTPAWRIRVPEKPYELDDLVQGRFSQVLSRDCGDFVIRRSDGLFAYQLATVVDDVAQGVNMIVRGMDLLVSTPQQLFLNELLGGSAPQYAHVPLLVAQRDRRLSKRDKDAGIEELMDKYRTPAGIVGHIAFLSGLIPEDGETTCEELLESFDIATLKSLFPDKVQIQWA